MDSSDPHASDRSRPVGAEKGGASVIRVLFAAVLTALLLDAIVSLLPDNPHQRWALSNEHWYKHLYWCYERIHFDPTPIDIALIGSSRLFYGIDPIRFETKMGEMGAPAHVANLSKQGAGRNVEWAMVQELFSVRKPRLLIIGIEDNSYPWGHVGFKDVATAHDLLAPPAPLLHNYFGDLVGLPKRQARLYAASYFPELFGLKRDFDRPGYDQTPLPWKESEWVDDLVLTDRNAIHPVQELLSERKPELKPTAADKLLLKCCNDGDDRVYLGAIARFARNNGASILFVHIPIFQGATTSEESDFVHQFGPLMDGPAIDDLRMDSTNFENWRHFNRIGAERLTDRLAETVVKMEVIENPLQSRN